jgi:hydroxymethylbilane synthase
VSGTLLRLGTRKSPMALAQSAAVASLIMERAGVRVELVGLTSFGDVSRADLAQIGGTGVFVSALRQCLLAGDVDLVVHSLKDLPTAEVPGIALAAVPARDDPRDALVARDGAKLADLPTGAVIGTGSPRRAAQLRLMRPDIRPVPVRGNAGTRLAKVTSGELDAVVLARAGLDRIGHLDLITEVFEPDEMVPAAGQGALAVECRDSDEGLAGLLGCADDPDTRAAVTAERAVLAGLQAGCHAPVGAYAVVTGMLRLTAVVIGDDGAPPVSASAAAPAAEAVPTGRQVARELLRRGAGRYVTAAAAHTSNGDDAQ